MEGIEKDIDIISHNISGSGTSKKAEIQPPPASGNMEASSFTTIPSGTESTIQSNPLKPTEQLLSSAVDSQSETQAKELQITDTEKSSKMIQFGDWKKTLESIKDDLDDFTNIFNEVRQKKMTAENMDKRIKFLAQSGSRTLAGFSILADQYSSQDREVNKLKSLLEEVLLNEGRFSGQVKHTFTENEISLTTTWMLPFATKGLKYTERDKIASIFKRRTKYHRDLSQAIRNNRIIKEK